MKNKIYFAIIILVFFASAFNSNLQSQTSNKEARVCKCQLIPSSPTKFNWDNGTGTQQLGASLCIGAPGYQQATIQPIFTGTSLNLVFPGLPVCENVSNCSPKLLVKHKFNNGVFSITSVLTSTTNYSIPNVTQAGTYTIVVDYMCGDVPCRNCQFKIDIKNVDSCRCPPRELIPNQNISVSWYYNGSHTSSPNPNCNSTTASNPFVIPDVSQNTSITGTVSPPFNCLPNSVLCAKTYSWTVHKHPSNDIIASGSLPNYSFIPPNAGIYYIQYQTICNNVVCKECKVFIQVKSIKPKP